MIKFFPDDTVESVEKILLCRRDGTVEEIKKGFAIDLAEYTKHQKNFDVHGCNLSGEELLEVCAIILAPFIDDVLNEDDEE